MGHELVWRGAMPVPFVGGDADDVAGANPDDLLAAGLNAPFAFDVQRLGDAVGVPCGAGAGVRCTLPSDSGVAPLPVAIASIHTSLVNRLAVR